MLYYLSVKLSRLFKRRLVVDVTICVILFAKMKFLFLGFGFLCRHCFFVWISVYLLLSREKSVDFYVHTVNYPFFSLSIVNVFLWFTSYTRGRLENQMRGLMLMQPILYPTYCCLVYFDNTMRFNFLSTPPGQKMLTKRHHK